MTTRVRCITAIVLLFIFVQVGVPAWKMTRPRPARFGWQMYAGLSEPLAFTLVRIDGSSEVVRLTDYLANYRGDIAVSRIIPPAVCVRNADALEVRYRVLPETVDRVFTCVH